MIYYLLSKDDFATLYKFGEVNIKVGAAAESDNPREAVKRLFSASDSFEYAQERLIVSSEKGSHGTVRMVDVKDIFPLDDISKNLFKSQFNASIIFSDPIFQDIAEAFLKNTVLERTTVSGIQALRTIFGLEPEKDDELIGDIIKGKIFLRKYKYFDIPLDVRTPYSMLIAYNRYQHYPKDSRGFFYDAADCFMYGYMFRSLSDPEEFLGYDRDAVARYCSKFHGLLDSIPADTRFRDIALAIEESDQRIKDAIAQVYGSIRFMALYLYAKERILVDDTISLNGIKMLLYIQKEYPAEFPKLVTLLGGFLGYTWVYDRSYEFKDCPFLRIHHKLEEILPMAPPAQQETKPVPSEETTTVETIIPSTGEIQSPLTVQSNAPLSEEPSSEVQAETHETAVTEESTLEEPVYLEEESSITQEDGVQKETETVKPQSDTERSPEEMNIPSPGEIESSLATQSNAPVSEEPSSEVQAETHKAAVNEESTVEESVYLEEESSIPQEDGVQKEPETIKPRPDTEQAPNEGPKPALDVPNIIRVVFKRCLPPRKLAFETSLKEHYDTVLQLAKEKDIEGLRGIYLKLDQNFSFKNNTDRQRIDDFVKTCTVLIYSMD